MDTTTIDEPVEVGAIFGKNKIRPKWFIWHNRKYLVKETTYTWQDVEGQSTVIHFTVSDGATLFELSLNQKSLTWRLEQTMVT